MANKVVKSLKEKIQKRLKKISKHQGKLKQLEKKLKKTK
jgi:Skp family chaperone for outer membrane proteins